MVRWAAPTPGRGRAVRGGLAGLITGPAVGSTEAGGASWVPPISSARVGRAISVVGVVGLARVAGVLNSRGQQHEFGAAPVEPAPERFLPPGRPRSSAAMWAHLVDARVGSGRSQPSAPGPGEAAGLRAW